MPLVQPVNSSGDEEARKQAEYDRLLHRRKGMSGSEFAGVGLEFAALIVVGTLGGLWLDKRLGSRPWLMIVGAFGGASLGFWEMYRRMVRSER